MWNRRHGRRAVRCLRSSDDPDEYQDHKPCAICGRPMAFHFRTIRLRRQPQTCSYQCSYRHKLNRQLERKRAERATVACIVCGERFTQQRRDAQTCSNRCRQKLFRQQQTALRRR